MPLTAGDRLGVYEIAALLGYGGMGEVYRARDTRLGREVAIKILPAAFATDPNRLARLEREARLISQVNHPNVCTLFHIGDASAPHETHFLVLELVEGETLQQRLIRGPLHVPDALRYAADIAAALEAAHAKGIIHRDLKPSNIKISAGRTIKVLDFGVAKLAEELDAGPHTSPLLTATLGGTREGALVGTVAYISPEQAMGDSVDKRTDIWAFGCVVYEMLTAERAFPGLAVADTLANVMRGEPNWTVLPQSTPPAIRKLLARCLEKDRTRRLADIGDARLEIDDAMAAAPVIAPIAPALRKGRVGFKTTLAFVSGIVLTVMVLGAFDFLRDSRDENPPPRNESPPTQNNVGAGAVTAPSPPSSKPADPTQTAGSTPPPKREDRPPATQPAPSRTTQVPTRTSINPPGGITWAPALARGIANTVLAISPDGRRIVFSGRDGSRLRYGFKRLTGRPRGCCLALRTHHPFWSPDGASVGFFADGSLKRLDLSPQSARPVTLCAVSNPRGATWGPDDTIVFAPYPGRALEQISANGGRPTPLTRLAVGEPHHVRPHFLAGSRHLVYRVTGSNGRNNAYYVMTLGSTERKLLMRVDSGSVMYGHAPPSIRSVRRTDGAAVRSDHVECDRRARVDRRSHSNVDGYATALRHLLGLANGPACVLPADSGDVPMTVLTNWAALLK